MSRQRAETTPDGYLGAGLLLLVVGGILGGYDGIDEIGGPLVLGLLLAAVGWVALAIGIVAKGVQVASRNR